MFKLKYIALAASLAFATVSCTTVQNAWQTTVDKSKSTMADFRAKLFPASRTEASSASPTEAMRSTKTPVQTADRLAQAESKPTWVDVDIKQVSETIAPIESDDVRMIGAVGIPASDETIKAESTASQEKVEIPLSQMPKPVDAETKTQAQAEKSHDTAAAPGISNSASAIADMEKYIQGEWLVSAIGRTGCDREEDVPYLIFDNGRFYANDGCNVLNGVYQLDADGFITFGNVLSSLKYCPNDDFANMIRAMVRDGQRLRLTTKKLGNESYIMLEQTESRTTMTLRCHNMYFLNGNWSVVTINGRATNSDQLTIFIDVPELKVHGNTGCNYFNGELYIDPMRSNAIDFNQMAVTLAACPDIKLQTAMLVALEQTASAIDGGRGRVILLDSSGNALMELEKN